MKIRLQDGSGGDDTELLQYLANHGFLDPTLEAWDNNLQRIRILKNGNYIKIVVHMNEWRKSCQLKLEKMTITDEHILSALYWEKNMKRSYRKNYKLLYIHGETIQQ